MYSNKCHINEGSLCFLSLQIVLTFDEKYTAQCISGVMRHTIMESVNHNCSSSLPSYGLQRDIFSYFS